MSLFVLDSDILDLYQTGHPAVCRKIHSHPVEELATTVITIEEHLSGWYTLLRIAAITLVHGGTLVTRNIRDFQAIPSLSIQDWSRDEDA
jgi:predicted nucleic acid-binding protein